MDERPWGRITLDHLGIATEDLDEAMRFWSLMGLWPSGEDETVTDQGVTTRFLPLDDQGARPPTQIELLEPTGHDTPVGRFIERRGPESSKCASRSMIWPHCSIISTIPASD